MSHQYRACGERCRYVTDVTGELRLQGCSDVVITKRESGGMEVEEE